MNDRSEIPRGIRFTLEEAARTGKAPKTLDRTALPRGVRFALDEAERAAKVAKKTLIAALAIIAGGCFLSLIAPLIASTQVEVVGSVAYAMDVLGYLLLGAFIAFIGLCVLLVALALRIRTKRRYRSVVAYAQDRYEGEDPPQWRDSLGAAALWRRPGGDR